MMNNLLGRTPPGFAPSRRAVFPRHRGEEWPEKFIELLEKGRTLNDGQLDVFTRFRNHVRFGDPKKPPELWIVGGGQGTGKSYLLEFFERDATLYHGGVRDDARSPVVMKMAPTGRSAANISGRTLFSALHLFVRYGERDELTPRALAKLRVEFQNCRLILVDDASMIGLDLLRHVSERLQEIKGVVGKPFGGIRVVLFGDLRSFPPVSDTSVYLPLSDTFVYLDAILHQRRASEPPDDTFGLPDLPDVKFYELAEVMRQRGDPKFAAALHNYAVGRTTQEDVELLRGRETTIERVPRTARWLFYSNREVEEARRRNDRLYGRPGEVTTMHNALGSTLDECAVFLDPDTNRHATYVALSRVKSVRDLYIVGVFHPSPDSDPASRILERLRQRPIATSPLS